MKLTIMTSLLLSGAIAMAETAPATTTTTAAAQQQPVVVAKAKKVKKAKKGKKVEEKTSQLNAPAAPAAAAAATHSAVTTAAPAATREAASMQSTTAKADLATAPAAATSTATVAGTAPKKKWGVTIVNEIDLVNDGGEGIRDLANASVDTINYIGASYKVTDKTTVGARQYFTYSHNPKVDSSIDNVKQGFAAVTAGTKVNGILGSDEIAPMFWYYLPNHTSEVNTYGKDLDQFYGQLRMDAEIGWTLNPKWSVSYYVNPRQSLGAKESFTKEDGTAGSFQATSRLIHYGFVYYTVNDNVQLYGDVGMDHRMATESLTSVSDDALSAIGANITLLGGKLIFNPEISNTVHLKAGGQYTSAPRWLQSEDMSYALTTVIAL